MTKLAQREKDDLIPLIRLRDQWEGTIMRAKAGIGYYGVASSIPPSDLPTLSVVDEGEETISMKH